MTQNNQRINPVVEQLCDLVYLTPLSELEAAIRGEGHTADELAEALPKFIDDLETVIKEEHAEISLLVSQLRKARSRKRVLLKVKEKIETEDWVD